MAATSTQFIRCFTAKHGGRRHVFAASRRSLCTDGTALVRLPSGIPITSELGFVKAHPWHNEESNDMVDNTLDSSTLFNGRRVALFAIPAPFTGTCTDVHVPAYMALQEEFAAEADELVCLSVTDPYTMDAWRSSLGIDTERITFLCDPTGATTQSWGLDWDLSNVSLGVRSKRFSLFADDGAVKAFNMVENAANDASLLLSQITSR